MFFHKSANAEGILTLIKPKLEVVLSNAKYGIDIEIKNHAKSRSLEQNNYLWAIYSHIVKFWQDTGFIPDGLRLTAFTRPILRLWRCRLIKVALRPKTRKIDFVIDFLTFMG